MPLSFLEVGEWWFLVVWNLLRGKLDSLNFFLEKVKSEEC